MADFTVPGTWTYDGSSNQNQVTYRVTGHTSSENYLVIFDRKPSVYSGSKFSKPSYRVRIIRSFVDGDGVPFDSKAVVDINISWDAAASSTKATELKAMVTLVGTIFSDIELPSDVIDDLVIPQG